jgi:SRSO17 transposase
MNQEELMEARGRLEAFLQPLLPLLGRSERRRWGAFYVQGMLLEGGRKTAASMAARYGGEVQALQQFVNQSPWDWQVVRQALAQQMFAAVSPGGAWIVDDTGFPKKGRHSVCVARQYSGTLGKVGNCQVALSLNYATPEGCFPVDFQLYLPKSWAEDTARAQRAGIPPHVTFRPNWQIALEMLAQSQDWGLPRGVVVADAAYGIITEFRRALARQGYHYVVGISKEIGVWTKPVAARVPPYRGRGPKPTRDRNLPPPFKVWEVAQSLPEEIWCEVSWREGSKGPLKGRFAAMRVQPSYGHGRGKVTESVCWLLMEWPPEVAEPTRYWLSNLPEHTSLRELVYWAKIRWWIEQNYQQLKHELGLDHFEGRSWSGWHHHVTLTMMAFNFLVLEGFRAKKNYWVDPPTCPARTPTHDYDGFGFLPPLHEANRI